MSSVKLALFSASPDTLSAFRSERPESYFESSFGFSENSIFNFDFGIGESSAWINFEITDYYDEFSFINSNVAEVIYGEIDYDEVGEVIAVVSYRSKKINLTKLNDKLLEENHIAAFYLSLYRNKIQLFNKVVKKLEIIPTEIFGGDVLNYVAGRMHSKIISYISDYYKKNGVDTKLDYDSEMLREKIEEGDLVGIKELKSMGMSFHPAKEDWESPLDVLLNSITYLPAGEDPVAYFNLLVELGAPLINSIEDGCPFIVSLISTPIELEDENLDSKEISIRLIEAYEAVGGNLNELHQGCSLLWWTMPSLRPYLSSRNIPFIVSDKMYESCHDVLEVSMAHGDRASFNEFLIAENIQSDHRFDLFETAYESDEYFVKELLKAGVIPVFKNGSFYIVHTIIHDGRFDLLKLLAEYKVEFHPLESGVHTSLIKYVEKKELDKIKELIAIGFDCTWVLPIALDVLSEDETAQIDFVRLVLESGVSPNIYYPHAYQAASYLTPLRCAKNSKNRVLEDLLIGFGAKEEVDPEFIKLK